MDEEQRVGFLTREKLLGIHHHRHFGLFVFLFGTILLLDIIYLNVRLFSTKEIFFLKQEKSDIEKNVPPNAIVVKEVDTCGEECKNQIEKTVSAAISNNKTTTLPSLDKSSVKEYFIPFGTGYVASTEWYDVPGLQSYIDGNAYGKIKTATFEVSVRVPTGNETADVRLYNITAKHPVWNSEVAFTGGGTPQFLISKPINLDPGSNLYKVQMKTQLQFPAYIDQSRVHIITY